MQALLTARQHMDSSKGPYAILVKRQTFLPYKLKSQSLNEYGTFDNGRV